jgi:hypothetical protein
MRLKPVRLIAGWTLRDCCTVVAVVSLLLVVTLASASRNEADGSALACRDNLRRLIQAWQMYADDHAGRIVPNNGSDPNQPRSTWAAGWLDYQSTDNTNTAFLVNPEAYQNRAGLLGPYLQRDASVFRCPADYSTVTLAGRVHRRVRSVSMNNWMGGDAYCGGSGGGDYRAYRALSEITHPADRWVIIEERPDSINDSWHAMRLGDKMGGWQLVDYPGNFHGNGAWISFADGQVVFRRWTDRRTLPSFKVGEFLPLQVPMNPPNPDVAWLQERASELK